jgi:hypothetical protein
MSKLSDQYRTAHMEIVMRLSILKHRLVSLMRTACEFVLFVLISLAIESFAHGEETVIRIEKFPFTSFAHKSGACCFDGAKGKVYCVHENHIWSRRIHVPQSKWIDEGTVNWHGDVDLVSLWRLAHDAVSDNMAIATADGRIVIRGANGDIIARRRFPFLLTANPDFQSSEFPKEAFVTSSLGISQIAFCNRGKHVLVGFFDGSLLKVDSKTLEITSVVVASPWRWEWVRRTALVPLKPDPFHQDPLSTLLVDVSVMQEFAIATDRGIDLRARAVSPEQWEGLDVVELEGGTEGRISANGSITWRGRDIRRANVCSDNLFGLLNRDGDASVVRLRCSDGVEACKWTLGKEATNNWNVSPVLVRKLVDEHQWLVAIPTKHDVMLCHLDDRHERPIKIYRSMPVPAGIEIGSAAAFIGLSALVVECTEGFATLDFTILEDGRSYVQ